MDAAQPIGARAGSVSIGLVSPGWPVEAFSNGVVTYVATLAPALQALGHRVSILTGRNAGTEADESIYNLARAHATRSVAQRLADSIAYRLSPRTALRHQHRRTLVATVRKAVAERGVQIIDMEESFGAASWVRRSAAVLVCVRLHGPWFLNGPADGARDDGAFRRRVRDEGEALVAVDAVSAPSRDVLQRAREHYGIELGNAEVIPNPVSPVPPQERWTIDGCDDGLVLFVGRFDRHKGGDLMIEAFERVVRQHARARLCFVGPDRGCVTGDGRAGASWSSFATGSPAPCGPAASSAWGNGLRRRSDRCGGAPW